LNEKFIEPGRLPSAEQALILRAALLPGVAGRQAAIDWLASADIQRLGKATRGILPILYERLCKDGFSAPLMPVLKGIKRHTWYNNRRLFHRGGEAIHLLKQAGIEVMVIKGASMVIDYYHDDSLRPMEDLDILVRYSDKSSALRLLIADGWVMSYKDLFTDQFFEDGLFETCKSWGLVHKSGVHLDLHWNLMPYCLGNVADNDFWLAAGECEFENLLVKVLNPADQLLHILVHGAPWSYISPVRWIPDAVMVLNRHPEFDWNRLIEQARQRSLAFMVSKALRDLDGYIDGLVPSRVLNALDRVPPTIFERIEYWHLTQPGQRGISRRIQFILVDYLRYSRGRSLLEIIRLMPHYLKTRFGAKGFCHFISIALVKISKHLSRTGL
jgi:hypothetical protein